MKNFNFKKDVWGVIFSVGIGVLSYLTYKVGKNEGSCEAYTDVTNELNVLLEAAEKAHIEQ